MKRDAAQARRAELALAAVPGVTLARVNPTTGSILLHFETTTWSAEKVLDLLRQEGYLGMRAVPDSPALSARRDRDVVLQFCAWIGKELLCAAIGEVFPHPVVATLLAIV